MSKPIPKGTMDMNWWVSKNVLHQNYEVTGRIDETPNQLACIMLPVAMQVMGPGQEGVMVSPAMQLTKESLQNLMDELWQQGFRPSSGDGNIGELSATKKHLEDMRMLVSGFMDLKK